MPLLTELVGREVVDATGVYAGRLVDLAVDLGEVEPEGLRLLIPKGRRGPLRELPWVVVEDLGPPVRLRPSAESGVASPEGEERNHDLPSAVMLDEAAQAEEQCCGEAAVWSRDQ